MPTTVLKHVKGDEIPKPWQKKVHPNPSKVYDITIILKEIPPLRDATNNVSDDKAKLDDDIEFGVFSLGKVEKITREEIYDYL